MTNGAYGHGRVPRISLEKLALPSLRVICVRNAISLCTRPAQMCSPELKNGVYRPVLYTAFITKQLWKL